MSDRPAAAELAATLTPYELRNLVAHLEAAGHDESVHRLLALEASGGANLWFAVKDARADLDGYVADVRRALRLVRGAADARIRADEPARDLGLEVRYALLAASVRGQVGNLPVSLVVALVSKGLWSPEAAVASLRQLAEVESRSRAIAALAPHVPASLLEQPLRETLAATRDVGDRHRSDALARLGPYLPAELLGEALEAAAWLPFGGSRSSVLAGLASSLTPEHLPAALGLARTIEGGQYRAEALAALGPRLPGELHEEAVATAGEIQEAPWRAVALAAVGEPLSREALREALAASSGGDWDRAEAAIRLAPSLPPELLREALAATRTLGSHRDRALAALAPHLPVDLLAKVLRLAQGLDWGPARARVLVALTPRLSGDHLDEALRLAGRIHDEAARAQALGALAQRLSQPGRGRVLRKAFAAAERIPFGAGGWDVVVGLVPELPEELLPDALKLARSLSPDLGRVEILIAVGARLPEPERGKVLREALRESRRMDDEWGGRSNALARLVPLLPGEVLPEVTGEVSRDEDQWTFRSQVAALVPFLDAGQLPEALRAARELRDARQQSAAVAALADYLDEPTRKELLGESLAVLPRVQRHWDRTMALAALAPKLPEELGAEALAIAKQIDYEAGARALAEVAPVVPPSLLSAAVGPARAILYEHWKAEALAALAGKADEPERSALFAEAVKAAGIIDYDEHPGFGTDLLVRISAALPDRTLGAALEAARWLHDDKLTSRSLFALAGRLSGEQRAAVLEEALAAARRIHFEESRVEALTNLGDGVPGVVEAIQEIGDPRWRAIGLARLGRAVPQEVVRAAIERVRRPDCDRDDVAPLVGLLPFASLDLVREALAAIAEMLTGPAWRRGAADSISPLGPEESLSRALAAIAPQFGEDVLPDLLNVTARIHPTQRAAALGALTARFRTLPRSRLAALWNQARAALDAGPRAEVLEALAALAPAIDAFGSRAGVRESVAAVQLVARWQP